MLDPGLGLDLGLDQAAVEQTREGGRLKDWGERCRGVRICVCVFHG